MYRQISPATRPAPGGPGRRARECIKSVLFCGQVGRGHNCARRVEITIILTGSAHLNASTARQRASHAHPTDSAGGRRGGGQPSSRSEACYSTAPMHGRQKKNFLRIWGNVGKAVRVRPIRAARPYPCMVTRAPAPIQVGDIRRLNIKRRGKIKRDGSSAPSKRPGGAKDVGRAPSGRCGSLIGHAQRERSTSALVVVAALAG